MSIYPLSFFINNPERFKFLSKRELSHFSKKVWKHDQSYDYFIRKYLKKNYSKDLHGKSGGVQRLLLAIACSMGYKSYSEFNDLHRNCYDIAIEKINSIEVPDTGSTVVTMGGFHSEDYKDEQFIKKLLNEYTELAKIYELLDDILSWIAVRKNGIVQHDTVTKNLRNYCILTLAKDVGFALFRQDSSKHNNSDLILASLNHFNIINLPNGWNYRLDSSKNVIKNIDQHHIIEPYNEYLKLRYKAGLLLPDAMSSSSKKVALPADKNLVTLLQAHFETLLHTIENELDRTHGNKEVLEEKFAEPIDYLHSLNKSPKSLLENFYTIVCSFSAETLYLNLSGLEFIRIALILFANLNNGDLFNTLSTVHVYLNWGLEDLRLKTEEEKELSIIANLPQFI